MAQIMTIWDWYNLCIQKKEMTRLCRMTFVCLIEFMIKPHSSDFAGFFFFTMQYELVGIPTSRYFKCQNHNHSTNVCFSFLHLHRKDLNCDHFVPRFSFSHFFFCYSCFTSRFQVLLSVTCYFFLSIDP